MLPAVMICQLLPLVGVKPAIGTTVKIAAERDVAVDEQLVGKRRRSQLDLQRARC